MIDNFENTSSVKNQGFRLDLPVLFTERLILRPFIREDAINLQMLLSDEEVSNATLHIPFPFEHKTAVSWIESHKLQFKAGSAVIFAIQEKYKESLMGSVEIHINKGHDSAELGFWLGKEHWNQGFIKEAIERMLTFAFEELQLNKIYASHFESNIASAKVLSKQGMNIEGILKEQVKHKGNYQNLVYWGLLKEEWLQRR